jgi:hypothetical protein
VPFSQFLQGIKVLHFTFLENDMKKSLKSTHHIAQSTELGFTVKPSGISFPLQIYLDLSTGNSFHDHLIMQ